MVRCRGYYIILLYHSRQIYYNFHNIPYFTIYDKLAIKRNIFFPGTICDFWSKSAYMQILVKFWVNFARKRGKCDLPFLRSVSVKIFNLYAISHQNQRHPPLSECLLYPICKNLSNLVLDDIRINVVCDFLNRFRLTEK